MRILNRVIVAGALVLPMALAASGVALAGTAAGSSALPTQIAASDDDHKDKCDKDDKGGFLGLFGGGNSTLADDDCVGVEEEDKEDKKGPLG